MTEGQTPPGWYHAEGDPPGTYRQWDGARWVGEPTLPEAITPPTPGQFQPPMGPPLGDMASPYDTGGAALVAGRPLLSAGGRIGGRLIDGLIWMLVGFLTSLPVIAPTFSEAMDAAREGRDPEPIDISLGLAMVTTLLNIALIIGYEVFMNSRFGGTLGKRAVSATIVRTDGSAIDERTALMRMVPYLAVQVFGLLLLFAGSAAGILQVLVFGVVGLAGLVMLFTDDRRQTPWDKVADTMVVRR